MVGGHSPPLLGAGGSDHGGDPPPGHTKSSTSPPQQHTTYDCSDNGSIDNMKKIITNIASINPHDDPLQLLLQGLLKVLALFGDKMTMLEQEIKALHNKPDTENPGPERLINNHSPQQPSWSTIAAGGGLAYPHLQRQGPVLAAVTAPIAIARKSPPQYYQRELLAHCGKGARAFESPIPRLVDDLKRAAQQSETVGELQSLRKLQSGDVILRFDTTESRDSWRRCEKDWMNVLGAGARLKERHYTVLIHGMQKRECQDSDRTIAELYRTTLDYRKPEYGFFEQYSRKRLSQATKQLALFLSRSANQSMQMRWFDRTLLGAT